MDKESFFILNIFLNSFLAFFTVVFLVESVIFLFRIRQGRVAATLRMIPIIKLPFDLCLYDFSRWSYMQGINPFHCEEGTRTLSVLFGITDGLLFRIHSTIQFTLPGDLTFTLADLVGYSITPMILRMGTLLFILITLSCVLRKIMLYYLSFVDLGSWANGSQPLSKKIKNLALCSYLKKRRVKILTSSALRGSPFVTGFFSSTVYISDHLAQNLSQKEYEAVLAHEMEHVRYRDGLVRFALDIIQSIFWWIPTKWLCSKIKEGQEVGCDATCKKYGIEGGNLASAIAKSAKHAMNTPPFILAHQLAQHTILKRIELLLQPPTVRFKKTDIALTCLACGVAFSVIFLGRFWIF